MPRDKQPYLLVTRPEPDSQVLAAMLPEFPAIISPIMRIAPVNHSSAQLYEAEGLVFTSAHAVPFAGPGRGRIALCVGKRTAQTAREAGFDVQLGDGGADGLLPLIKAATVRLIHPHGRHTAKTLPVEGIVVYEQIPQALNKPARLVLATNAPAIIPLFSPRSAMLLSDQLAAADPVLWMVALSNEVAEKFQPHCDRKLIAASHDLDDMVNAIRLITRMEQS